MSSKYPLSWPPLPDTLTIEISTQNFQGIFLGVKNIIHDVRNDYVLHVSGQELSTSSKYPPSWPPPSWHTSNWEINSKFLYIFLGVKKHHSWHQESPSHPFCWSGTLNVLQVPPFLTPPSWHTSNWDINTKLSGYLPWRLSKSSIDCMVIEPKAQVMGRRPTQQPSAGARMKGL